MLRFRRLGVTPDKESPHDAYEKKSERVTGGVPDLREVKGNFGADETPPTNRSLFGVTGSATQHRKCIA